MLVLIALLCLVTSAIAVRLPGVHWLIGYGYESDYSFHPDEYRFIISAKDFRNPLAKPAGYPLFMPTQLFVINSFLHNIMRVEFNHAVVLRCIGMTYAILSVILSYVFLRFLGFSRLVCILSSFFLTFAPLHIISSHFGTADMSVFFLFYLTIFAAWRYGVSNNELWFYTTVALAGVAMADKFFLPSLIPAAVIIFWQPSKRIWGSIFISMCVFMTFFCAASFFNYTPWDLAHLLRLLAVDNFVVDGGKSPLQQVILYSWDLIACSGFITSGLAFIGCAFLFHRFRISRLRGVIEKISRKEISFSNIAEKIQIWLHLPGSVVILPLLFHAVLIVTAQVHFSRHILVFVPIICLLAAIAVGAIRGRLTYASRPVQAIGTIVILGLLGIQLADGVVTDWIYPADVRAKLGDFLAERQLAFETSTFSGYTLLKGVSMTNNLPETPSFVSCDLEYRRYLLAGQGKSVYHVFGGKSRTDFFISLLGGQTSYAPVFDIKRKRLGLEDYLAEKGWLPEIDTYVPNECRAFQKRGSQS
jgi:hypothetical protein